MSTDSSSGVRRRKSDIFSFFLLAFFRSFCYTSFIKACGEGFAAPQSQIVFTLCGCPCFTGGLIPPLFLLILLSKQRKEFMGIGVFFRIYIVFPL